MQLLPCPVVLPCAEAAVEKAWQDIDAQLQDCDPASPHVDEDPIWKVRWASFAPCVCVCVCVCVCACVCVHVCACVCVCVSFLFCCAFSPSTPKLHLGFFVHCLPCPPVCDAMRCDAMRTRCRRCACSCHRRLQTCMLSARCSCAKCFPS